MFNWQFSHTFHNKFVFMPPLKGETPRTLAFSGLSLTWGNVCAFVIYFISTAFSVSLQQVDSSKDNNLKEEEEVE